MKLLQQQGFVLVQKPLLGRFAFTSTKHRDENQTGDLPLLKRVWSTWSGASSQSILSGFAQSSGVKNQIRQVPAVLGTATHGRGLL